MSIWKDLFHGKKKTFGKRRFSAFGADAENGAEPDWDDVLFHREDLDVHDADARRAYVQGALEQLKEAEQEIHTLTYEYELVTSHLTDVNELEALPKDVLESLRETASQITQLDDDKEQFERKRRMSDAAYAHMQQWEEEIPSALAKLKEAEEYQKKVKADLRRLHTEKQNVDMQHEDLENVAGNYVGMTRICFGTIFFCILVLAILQIYFRFDTRLGYVVVVCAMAAVIVHLYVRHSDAQKQMQRLELQRNKLTLLMNTVKIRYVNNKNLLDYMKLKYRTESSEELEGNWEAYQEEKEAREQQRLAAQDYTFFQKELLRKLREARIRDTSVWLHQTKAICDRREMVELRHGLLVQRAALRERMDRNKKLSFAARSEVRDLCRTYPQYGDEILAQVAEMERRMGQKA